MFIIKIMVLFLILMSIGVVGFMTKDFIVWSWKDFREYSKLEASFVTSVLAIIMICIETIFIYGFISLLGDM